MAKHPVTFACFLLSVRSPAAGWEEWQCHRFSHRAQAVMLHEQSDTEHHFLCKSTSSCPHRAAKSASTHHDIRAELLQLHSLQSGATDPTSAEDATAGISGLPIPSVPLLCILPKAGGTEPRSRVQQKSRMEFSQQHSQ